MKLNFNIRPLKDRDIPLVTKWARDENFAPGQGDLGIYKHTDQQGIWTGLLNDQPIGCISGVKYNNSYGFIGLFIVVQQYRGKGFGLQLWKKAISHLSDVTCIGLEAAPDRVVDYAKWGFRKSSLTTRWELKKNNNFLRNNYSIAHIPSVSLLEGSAISSDIVNSYDEKREPTPRPHFLSDWLKHPAGKVLALVDDNKQCHGFGRIRPCLLKGGEGWRIGPLIADTSKMAEFLLRSLIIRHSGSILIDSPGLNPRSDELLERLGFDRNSKTFRMYKGFQPPILINDIYGLASLELG